jgi:hypothetical protein
MADVPDPNVPAEELTQRDRHMIGMPLTGAVFDLLVEVFQEFLVEERFISRELDELSRQGTDAPAELVQTEFDRAYAGRHDVFKVALLDARDYVGRLLARTWHLLDWTVTFDGVAAAMLAADVRLTGGAGRNLVIDNLSWRDIDVGFRRRRSPMVNISAASRYADRRW